MTELLTAKVALVTGSSRGIGAEIATCFARHGARVVLHGRDVARLAALRDDIERGGGSAIHVTGDLTRFGDIEALRREIEDRAGPVEILVANAGNNFCKPGPLVTQAGPVEDASEEVWRATLDANLTATFLTLKSFLPGMKARRSGTIITMSSVAGRRPHRRAPIAYAVAKAGIELLTQNVAEQVGPYNVRVNCIAPATIVTDGNRARMSESERSTLSEQYPLRQLGTPDDVANAALFLASDRSAWITGVILDVAGGLVMK